MKCCLRVRSVILFALLCSIGLWLSGGETKATEAKQQSIWSLGRPARSVFDTLLRADVAAPWAKFFDHRQLVWSFAPKAVALPLASITVTTTADTLDAAANCNSVTLASLPGPDGQTSLREAVCAANSNAGADTITFSVNGTFALTGAANEDNGNSGDLDIKGNVTINGNGAANTIIDGSGIERLFDVFPASAITFDLSNLTLQNGDTRTNSFKEGGAVYLHNNVTSAFTSVRIINNFSGANGAIENRGGLTISNSTISGNSTIPASGTVVGGGIRNAGTLSLNNTTISNNTVRGEGGGIATSTGEGVVVTITNTTVSGNTASITGGGLGNGGGISTTGNQGTINIINSTISGNRADNNGGGAYFVTPGGGTGNVTLTNVTLTNNTADNDDNSSGAGGGFAVNLSPVLLRNTIVAGNFNSTAAVRDDISGAVVASSSFNLIGDGTGSTGITNGANNNQVGSGASPVNPLLGPLANNGGPTETHALLIGSPAIDTGSNALAPATDQRGVARPVNGIADKGAYEVNDATPPDTTITSNPTNPSNSTSATFTFTGSDNVTAPGSLTFECQIDGGAFSACTSPRTYLGLSDGAHTFQVRAVDAAGNMDNTPASFTWTVDATPPTVTINQAAGQSDPTASSPIQFTVVFSEAVTDFDDAADVSLSGTAGATTVSITLVSATTYTVSVSGMIGVGTVSASIPLNVAVDGAGNGNAASSSTDNTVSYVICPSFPATIAAGDVAGLVTAVTCANINGAGTNDVINLTNSTYTFSDDYNDSRNALPAIISAATNGTLTINGNGATLARSSAGGTPDFRFFQINGGANLTLNSLTLTNGRVNGAPSPYGGAIRNNGTLAINSSTLSGNYAQNAGGAIANENSGTVLNIADSTFTNNITPNGGGAIYSFNGAVLTILRSTFNGNQAAGVGDGGAIYTSFATATIINSTISGNSANGSVGGGGMYINGSTVTLTNSTITGNSMTSGNGNAGGGGLQSSNNSTISLNNTIIIGNTSVNSARDNCSRFPVSDTSTYNGNYSLTQSGTGCPATGTNITAASAAAVLNTTLGNNGGPTQTHALISGSPAINAGSNALAVDANNQPLTTDQRGTGFPRQLSSMVDIGAYEFNDDTTPPDTTITSNPANPSNSASATFSFTGSDNVTAPGSLTFECQIDGGGFSACTSPRTYLGLSDGAHTFQVRAIDQANNTDPTPASFTWTIDATPPDTTITATPTNPSNSVNASFSFTGNDASGTGVASFECQLDSSGFSACTSPKTYVGLNQGNHTFQVRAIDGTGNVDSSPASFTWVVDTVAPDTTITANPTNPSNSANASFSFTGSDPGGSGVASFECQLDGGGFSACTSPRTYLGLSDGSHTFQVRAVDAAGNTDPTPASFTWTIDATPPDTTITATPTNPSNSVNASFSFTGNDSSGTGVASFECQLDSGGFTACTSPKTYIGLSDGSHTFQVRAVDAAGNTDATPASFTWVVDTLAPDTTITANPTNPSASMNASFSFTGNDPGGSGVSVFECQLDGGGFTACTSPKTYPSLSDGSHTFQVRARDAAGNTDSTPASFSWVIDATPPETTITSSPPNPSSSTSASFSFTGNDGGGTGVSGFECKLDGGAFVSCTSPQTYNSLALGPHTFQVRALDALGNADQTPASYTWSVNAPPTITPANLARAAGSTAHTASIANANDAEDPEEQLIVQLSTDGTSFSDSVTAGNVTVALLDQNGNAPGANPSAAGAVMVTLTTPCDAVVGPLNLFLRVTDSAGQSDTKPWVLTITANAPPVLSYSGQTVIAGATLSFGPATGPSDNGTLLPIMLASITPAAGLGLSVHPATGVVTVTSASLAGNYTVVISVSDNCGAPTNATFTVNVVCPAITLAPTTLPTATVNAAYPQTLSASPAGGNYSFSLSSGALPAGLTLNSNGSFSGAPTQSGSFNFRITATGWGGCMAFRDYTLVVTCPQVVTLNPASLGNATVGTAYGPVNFTATPAGSYSFAVTSGALPAGLTLASNGTLAGTPTQGGTYTFTVTATAGACPGSRSYTLVVDCPAITLTTASPLPNGQAGVSYAQTLGVTPAGSYTFALVSGNLPNGLTLNPTSGALSGLPTATGTFSFTVKAQAANGCFGTKAYTLVVNCPTVVVNPASLPSGAQGTAYNQTLAATPAGGNYSFSVTSGTLPTGLNLNPATGVLSGTPTANGSFTFTVTATGWGGCTGNRQYTLVIGTGGCPTITLPASLPNGQIGQLYSQSVAASPAGSYTYTLTGTVPPGVTFYNAAALLHGYPTTNGSYSFTIKATNSNNCMKEQSYTVNIGAAAALARAGDFDGDGKADTSVWRSAQANWLIVQSSDNTLQTQSWGASGDQQVSGDYDGDGKVDLAVFSTSGHWRIKRSSDGVLVNQLWGLVTDVPVAGDYDGDKKTDIAVWRGSSGYWYITHSATGQIRVEQWGLAAEPYGDVAVPGDYDGDGKTDLAVFRRLDGTWYIRRSSDGTVVTRQWGLGTDTPVPGDYDGDGKTDLAVWRGQNSVWYIIRSSTGVVQTVSWGASYAPYHDAAVPGDYDGDGKTDIAVWRPAAGMWYSLNSSDGSVRIRQHGQAGDLPVTVRVSP